MFAAAAELRPADQDQFDGLAYYGPSSLEGKKCLEAPSLVTGLRSGGLSTTRHSSHLVSQLQRHFNALCAIVVSSLGSLASLRAKPLRRSRSSSSMDRSTTTVQWSSQMTLNCCWIRRTLAWLGALLYSLGTWWEELCR